MLIKAILFDLDGVILDSEKVYCEFWVKASRYLGYELAYDVALQLRSCDSSIAREIVGNYLKDDGAYSKIRTMRKKMMEEYLSCNSYDLKPGVINFLQSISTKPYKKVIVTSANPNDKIVILKKLGIYCYFDDIISVNDAKRNKPYPDLYEQACNKLGLTPAECVAIEDSPNGITSAYDAGVNVIMVPDLTKPDKKLLSMCKVVERIDYINDDYINNLVQ